MARQSRLSEDPGRLHESGESEEKIPGSGTLPFKA